MWKIAKKDLQLFFGDRRALLLTLMLPIGLSTLFALAFGGVGSDNAGTPPMILLFTDADNSSASHLLIATLDSIHGIDMKSETRENAEREIKDGDYTADLVISKGFSDSLMNGKSLPAELLYDKSQEMQMGIIENVVAGVLSAMSGRTNADQGIDRMLGNMMPFAPQSVKDSIKTQIQQQMPSEDDQQNIRMTSIVGDAESNWGLIQAVAGTAVMMLLFSVSAIGGSLLQEKEDGVLRKLLQSPLRPYDIPAGKMITAAVVGCFQLVVMFIYAWLAFGLHIFINIPALVIMIVATAIACASFGVLLASIATSKRQIDAMRTIVILFMSAIGGSMIPLFIMPLFMQHFAVISVNYWSIQGFYDIFWRQNGLQGIAYNVVVLLGMSALLLTVSAFFYRKNILRII